MLIRSIQNDILRLFMAEKPKNWIKRHPIWTGIIGIIILGLIWSALKPNNLPTQTSNNPSNQPSNNPSLTTQQKIEQDVQAIIDPYSSGTEAINFVSYDNNTKQTNIFYYTNDYNTELLIQDEQTKIYQKLFNNYNINNISIESDMNFTDSYGQRSEQTAVFSYMSKETANKINWNNFISSNLPTVADGYYVSPVIQGVHY